MSKTNLQHIRLSVVWSLLCCVFLLRYILIEQVRVSRSDESDWWEAESVETGEMGMIPRNYVVPDTDDKQSQPYDTLHTVFFLYE